MRATCGFTMLIVLVSTASAHAQTAWPYRGDQPMAPVRTHLNAPRIVQAASFSQEAMRMQPLPQIPTRLLAEDGDKAANGNEKEKQAENGNGKEKEEKPPQHIRDNSFLIEEAYNQGPDEIQHIFSWVHFWKRERGVTVREFQHAYTPEIPIFTQTHQFSFQTQFLHNYERVDGAPSVEEGGFGDLLINYRVQLFVEDEHENLPSVAPRVSVFLPTGDRSRGLGTGEVGYQCNLPISKQVEPFAFHFNAGLTYFPKVTVPLADGSDSPQRDLVGCNLGVSAIYLLSYDFNFMLEAVAFFDQSLDELGGRDHTTEVILNPGFRWAVFTGEDVQWVLGVGVPIGLTRDAPDVGVFGYMSVEHNFLKQPENGK